MKKITQESFLDIIWPIIKEFTSSKDCVRPFNNLQEYFNQNGVALNHESKMHIHSLFDEIGFVIRDGIFDLNMPDSQKESYEQSYDFLHKCAVEMAKRFQIPPFSTNESVKILEERLEQWFDRYSEIFNDDNNKEHLFEFKNTQDYLKFLQSPEAYMQKLKELSPDEIIDEVFYANADLNRGYGPFGQYVIDETIPFMDSFMDGVDEKQIKNLLLFLESCPYVKKQLEVVAKIRRELKELSDEAKLSKYYQNPKFISDCKKMISLLTKNDRYHGTSCSALESIMQNGLYMVQKNLDSTSYLMRRFRTFGDVDALLNGLLLYRTGFDRTRGEGIVFLKEGAVASPVLKDENVSVDYSMTGPFGVQYKVSPEDIIGTIDLVNRQVKFGPEFEKRNPEREL